jgi:hypothetical protein
MRLLLASALLACSACGASPDPGGGAAEVQRIPLGLSSTLPIYWQESPDFATILKAEGEPGWVRQALETRFDLVPLDVLSAEALAPLDHLLLAQPRALSPAENVALDDWVRAGGQLLLFADPMLTSHSQFAIGDPRRPQDVVLLSPILARWGLELTFDTTQPQGERIEEAFEMAIPVDLAGCLGAVRPARHRANARSWQAVSRRAAGSGRGRSSCSPMPRCSMGKRIPTRLAVGPCSMACWTSRSFAERHSHKLGIIGDAAGAAPFADARFERKQPLVSISVKGLRTPNCGKTTIKQDLVASSPIIP